MIHYNETLGWIYTCRHCGSDQSIDHGQSAGTCNCCYRGWVHEEPKQPLTNYDELLVTIPAEALRWCPVGFVVCRDNVRYLYERRVERKDGVCVYFLWNTNFAGPHAFDTVQVAPAKYEAAVVAAICSLVDYVVEIRKTAIPAGSVVSVIIDGYDTVVPISADPRPWEDEYTIKIEG